MHFRTLYYENHKFMMVRLYSLSLWLILTLVHLEELQFTNTDLDGWVDLMQGNLGLIDQLVFCSNNLIAKYIIQFGEPT